MRFLDRIVMREPMCQTSNQEPTTPPETTSTVLKLRETIELIPNAILVVNHQGAIILANHSAEQLFGYSHAELLHMPIEELLPERFRQIHAHHRVDFQQQQKTRIMGTVNELFARHQDGSEIPVEIGLNPIHTPTETLVIASIANTSRRFQAEQAQHQSEERFRELVESTKIIPWEADGQTYQFTFVGPQAVKILRYPLEAWYGKDFWVNHLHPDDRDIVIDFCHAAAQKQEEYEFDYRMVSADRRIIWFHDIVRVKKSADGTKTLHGFLIDITSRKHVETERQALLEIMRSVVTTNDLIELLVQIHHTIAHVIYAENFFITLYNKTTGLFEEVYSVDKYDPPSQPLDLGKSITHYVFRTRQPVLLTHERFEALVAQGEVELVGTDSPSWLGVPLQTPTETIGVMVVQHYEETNCYSEQDVAFFASIAGQIALIIERKWGEEKLRESETRYRSLIENLPIGVYRNTPGPAGHFLMVNPTFVRMFGYQSENELQTVTVADLYMNPAERHIFSTYLAAHGSVTGVELRLKKRDGRPLWGSVTARVVYDEKGEPNYFDCTVEDITHRKQAEDALLTSQQHFYGLFQNVPVSIWEEDLSGVRQYLNNLTANGITDLETYFDNHPEAIYECISRIKILDVNQATLSLYGAQSKDELLHDLNLLFNEPSLSVFKAEFTALALGKTTFETEMDAYDLHHRPLVLTLNLNIAPGYEQSWSRVFVAITDITDRKKAELEARHRADEFAALYEIAHDLTLQWNLPRLLETVLERAIDLLHVKAGGIYLYDATQNDMYVVMSQGGSFPVGIRLALGEGLAGRVAELRQPIMLDDYHSWEGQSPHYHHIPIRAIVGVPMIYGGELIGVLLAEEIGESERRFNEYDVRLLSLLAGQAASAVHNARLYEQVQRYTETLEQRVAERTQELAHANDQLTVLDRLKSRFVADVSHELRTPVSSLKLYLDLLERNPTGNREKYMRVLQMQTERLQDLIENILDLSRLELGRDRIAFEPLSLNDVVTQVVSAYQLRAQAKGLTLTFTPVEALPLILGEHNQLAQVVTNLVMNSLNYTNEGYIHIRTAYQVEMDRVMLEVRDTGSGILPEDRPHLFQRFYRGSQHRQGGIPGTGLGLAIVKEILDIHKGQIEVESEMNVGTIFRIYLSPYRKNETENSQKSLGQDKSVGAEGEEN